jgi:hypothetical protein
MKRILLSLVLATTLVLSACDSQSDVNEPLPGGGDTQTLLKAIETFDVSDEQLGQLEEMFWLEEDMTLLLNPSQTRALNTIIDNLSPNFAGDRDPRRIAFDMGALAHLRLILNANPDMDEAKKQALLDLIKAANQARMEAIQNHEGTPEELREKLKAIHDTLIEDMNDLLSSEELQNVEDLKERIRQLREELRQKWVDMRIAFQLRMWTQILGLTEEQVDAIRQILLDQHAAIQQARIDFAGNPEGLRDKMKEILEGTDEKIKDVLDEKQDVKWDRLKNMRLDWRRGHNGGGIGPRG